jgi:hypothetical protein
MHIVEISDVVLHACRVQNISDWFEVLDYQVWAVAKPYSVLLRKWYSRVGATIARERPMHMLTYTIFLNQLISLIGKEISMDRGGFEPWTLADITR